MNDAGASVTHGVTLFGDGREILEPWLDLDFSMESGTLTRPDGQTSRIEAGHHVGWRTPEGEWKFVPGSFPDLEPFEREWQPDLDSDLFESLRARYPEQAELLTEIEEPIAGGAQRRSARTTRPSSAATSGLGARLGTALAACATPKVEGPLEPLAKSAEMANSRIVWPWTFFSTLPITAPWVMV